MHCSKLSASEKKHKLNPNQKGGLKDDSPSARKEKYMLNASSIRNEAGGMLAHGESRKSLIVTEKKKKTKGENNE